MSFQQEIDECTKCRMHEQECVCAIRDSVAPDLNDGPEHDYNCTADVPTGINTEMLSNLFFGVTAGKPDWAMWQVMEYMTNKKPVVANNGRKVYKKPIYDESGNVCGFEKYLICLNDPDECRNSEFNNLGTLWQMAYKMWWSLEFSGLLDIPPIPDGMDCPLLCLVGTKEVQWTGPIFEHPTMSYDEIVAWLETLSEEAHCAIVEGWKAINELWICLADPDKSEEEKDECERILGEINTADELTVTVPVYEWVDHFVYGDAPPDPAQCCPGQMWIGEPIKIVSPGQPTVAVCPDWSPDPGGAITNVYGSGTTTEQPGNGIDVHGILMRPSDYLTIPANGGARFTMAGGEPGGTCKVCMALKRFSTPFGAATDDVEIIIKDDTGAVVYQYRGPGLSALDGAFEVVEFPMRSENTYLDIDLTVHASPDAFNETEYPWMGAYTKQVVIDGKESSIFKPCEAPGEPIITDGPCPFAICVKGPDGEKKWVGVTADQLNQWEYDPGDYTDTAFPASGTRLPNPTGTPLQPLVRPGDQLVALTEGKAVAGLVAFATDNGWVAYPGWEQSISQAQNLDLVNDDYYKSGVSPNHDGTPFEMSSDELGVPAPQDYGSLTVSELDAMLKERGLPTSGRKADKIERLERDDT